MPKRKTKAKSYSFGKRFNLPRKQLLIFVLIFGIIGSYLLWKAFAAVEVGRLEAEAMQITSGTAQVVSDGSASGSMALKMNSSASATGTVSTTDIGTSLAIRARGDQCGGAPIVSISIDGGTAQNASVSSSTMTTYALNFSNSLPVGSHSIKATFTNPYTYSKQRGKSGKDTTCTRALYLDVFSVMNDTPPPPPAGDTTLPSVSITSPSNGASVSGTQVITASASDNIGVAKVQFFVDGALKSTVNAIPYNYAWDTTVLTNGSSHSIYAIAVDTSGNSKQSTTVTVTVNNVAPPPSGVVPTGVSGTWSLKFDDEFDGTSLDLNKWSNCWFPTACGRMNNVTTSPSNLAVSGGSLILTLPSSTSGALVSSNPHGGAKVGYEFQYGVVEARIYFPGNGSQCYNWPAWWTDPQSWPSGGENDIAEVLGGSMTVNYHSGSGSHNQGAVPGYWCGGYHTYTLHRQAGKADVYYDGVKVKSYSTDDGGALQYMIINVGYNSSYPTVYGSASQVKVDYVRAWQ